jgi:hypothetical protein
VERRRRLRARRFTVAPWEARPPPTFCRPVEWPQLSWYRSKEFVCYAIIKTYLTYKNMFIEVLKTEHIFLRLHKHRESKRCKGKVVFVVFVN